MVAVHVGTDTYGRVKRVGATSVVTKFAMIYAFPLIPRESYYMSGAVETTTEGIPFVFTTQTTRFQGLPLARLDGLSVAMAYLRGLFGTLTVVGSFYIVLLVSRATGQRHDEFVDVAGKVLLTCLAAGVGGGLLTYIPGIQTTARDRAIRRECGEILGICADPARVRDDVVRSLGQALREQRRSMLAEQKRTGISESPEVALQFQLLAARIRLALGEPDAALEAETDEILGQIEQYRRG